MVSIPRAKLNANCKPRGTDNVQGQISEHISMSTGGYCIQYPLNIMIAFAA